MKNEKITLRKILDVIYKDCTGYELITMFCFTLVLTMIFGSMNLVVTGTSMMDGNFTSEHYMLFAIALMVYAIGIGMLFLFMKELSSIAGAIVIGIGTISAVMDIPIFSPTFVIVLLLYMIHGLAEWMIKKRKKI